MNRQTGYSPKFRERAVRLVFEHQPDRIPGTRVKGCRLVTESLKGDWFEP
jgi:hypothetical protein